MKKDIYNWSRLEIENEFSSTKKYVDRDVGRMMKWAR